MVLWWMSSGSTEKIYNNFMCASGIYSFVIFTICMDNARTFPLIWVLLYLSGWNKNIHFITSNQFHYPDIHGSNEYITFTGS